MKVRRKKDGRAGKPLAGSSCGGARRPAPLPTRKQVPGETVSRVKGAEAEPRLGGYCGPWPAPTACAGSLGLSPGAPHSPQPPLTTATAAVAVMAAMAAAAACSRHVGRKRRQGRGPSGCRGGSGGDAAAAAAVVTAASGREGGAGAAAGRQQLGRAVRPALQNDCGHSSEKKNIACILNEHLEHQYYYQQTGDKAQNSFQEPLQVQQRRIIHGSRLLCI
ncbi:uncharacterized protein LOC125438805 [Sphaerodactylus townsendi]|uniref:uncharacterized protein LOC125438805 n=1 Tax=Sphaerodactylus townsendi TaxID=933632 RepID=UPI002027094D|nr:uncharacterized protein LOC125438805 [Sphaerodactylus townsendi]